MNLILIFLEHNNATHNYCPSMTQNGIFGDCLKLIFVHIKIQANLPIFS